MSRAIVTAMALSCSAKGCREQALWRLLWNNPALHSSDRRKTWLACDVHRSTLGDFLDARGFLRGVQPIGGAAGPGQDDGPPGSFEH